MPKMFTVKRLGRNGMWNAVSLIDENGSFRGEARFESREQADQYLVVYLQRMKDRLKGSSSSNGLQVKVFDDDQTVEAPPVEPQKPKSTRKAKKKSKKPQKRDKKM